MSIRERVIKVIRDTINSSKEIDDTDNLVDDLGYDELDNVEMVMALESEFSIEIPDEDAEEFLNVSDVVRYIEDKVEE